MGALPEKGPELHILYQTFPPKKNKKKEENWGKEETGGLRKVTNPPAEANS
jgi:hypothetical protein